MQSEFKKGRGKGGVTLIIKVIWMVERTEWKYEDEKKEEVKKKSKDTTINGEGKELLECINETGRKIINGCIKEDEYGNYMYL